MLELKTPVTFTQASEGIDEFRMDFSAGDLRWRCPWRRALGDEGAVGASPVHGVVVGLEVGTAGPGVGRDAVPTVGGHVLAMDGVPQAARPAVHQQPGVAHVGTDSRESAGVGRTLDLHEFGEVIAATDGSQAQLVAVLPVARRVRCGDDEEQGLFGGRPAP